MLSHRFLLLLSLLPFFLGQCTVFPKIKPSKAEINKLVQEATNLMKAGNSKTINKIETCFKIRNCK
jgi:hypothetical protein